MTQLPQHIGGAQIVRLPGDRAAVTGTLDQLGQVLDAARRSGRLLEPASLACSW